MATTSSNCNSCSDNSSPTSERQTSERNAHGGGTRWHQLYTLSTRLSLLLYGSSLIPSPAAPPSPFASRMSMYMKLSSSLRPSSFAISAELSSAS